MKVYVVTHAVSDDDGNFYALVEGIYTEEPKAISKVKEVHDEVVGLFENPEDNYEDGDRFFEISEGGNRYLAFQIGERNVYIHRFFRQIPVFSINCVRAFNDHHNADFSSR